MKIRMYNVGYGDCFCLRDKRKNLLVDFGSSNNRIGKQTRSDVFDVIISDLTTIEDKNLLLTHFHLDHLSGLLYLLKKKNCGVEFGCIYLPDVFSRPEMSRTLALLLLADLIRDSYLPSRQVSLFTLVEVLLKNPANIELLSRGSVFQEKYQALWPDMDVIARETDEVFQKIEAVYQEELELVVEFSEKLRRIIWAMTSEGRAQREKNTRPPVSELERDFKELRSTEEFQRLLSHMQMKKLGLRQFKSKISIVFQNHKDGEINRLFTGDVPTEYMRMIAENYDEKISLYEHYWCIKVPHHGTDGYYFDFAPYMPENLLISNGGYYADGKKKAKALRTSARYAGLFQIRDAHMYCSNCDCCDGYNNDCSCKEAHVIAPRYYFDI